MAGKERYSLVCKVIHDTTESIITCTGRIGGETFHLQEQGPPDIIEATLGTLKRRLQNRVGQMKISVFKEARKVGEDVFPPR